MTLTPEQHAARKIGGHSEYREAIRLSPTMDRWRERLAGRKLSIFIDLPESGYYADMGRLRIGGRRIVRHVAKIWWSDGEPDEDGEFTTDLRCFAEFDAAPADPYVIWSRVAANPITRKEYDDWLFLILTEREPSDIVQGSVVP